MRIDLDIFKKKKKKKEQVGIEPRTNIVLDYKLEPNATKLDASNCRSVPKLDYPNPGSCS